MGDNIFEVGELTKNFLEQFTVSGVSLGIKRNTTYGLLGLNGAGKPTTLKLVLGPLRPAKGGILSDGEPWKRKHLAKIGSLIEEPALYGNLTAEESLLVRTKLLGVPKDKIYEVLETADLKDTGNKRASQFSRGIKERPGITIALLNDPSLLILGGPTNGLDPADIQELHELIVTFPRKGVTVISSSHTLSEVKQIVGEIGIINKGQLMFQETPNRDENLETLFMEVIKGGARR